MGCRVVNWEQLATPPETIGAYYASLAIAQSDWHYGILSDVEFIGVLNCIFHLAWEDLHGFNV